jgi:hypothetical protein
MASIVTRAMGLAAAIVAAAALVGVVAAPTSQATPDHNIDGGRCVSSVMCLT